jgi:hypothetical protein
MSKKSFTSDTDTSVPPQRESTVSENEKRADHPEYERGYAAGMAHMQKLADDVLAQVRASEQRVSYSNADAVKEALKVAASCVKFCGECDCPQMSVDAIRVLAQSPPEPSYATDLHRRPMSQRHGYPDESD